MDCGSVLLWKALHKLFKDGKQHFGMGKLQSQDFNGQIADISIAIMVHYVFSLVKHFESYETLDASSEKPANRHWSCHFKSGLGYLFCKYWQ
jgi:hypothetical protein